MTIRVVTDSISEDNMAQWVATQVQGTERTRSGKHDKNIRASLLLFLCCTGTQTPGQGPAAGTPVSKYSQIPQVQGYAWITRKTTVILAVSWRRQMTPCLQFSHPELQYLWAWSQQDPGGFCKSPPFLTFGSFPIKLLHFIPIPSLYNPK